MAKKQKQDEAPKGSPAWMSTYGDMVTLLLCFFVLLFSMSSVDIAKFKAAMSSFADQIDVLPGGEALTEGELLDNGISQLTEVQVVFSQGMPIDDDGQDLKESQDTSQDNSVQQDQANLTEEEKYKLAGKIAKEFEKIIQQEGFESSVELSLTPNYVKFTLQGEFLFDSGKANLKEEAKSAISVIANIASQEKYKDYDIQIDGHTDNVPISSAQYPNNWILSSYRSYAVLDELIRVHGFAPERVSATGYGEYRPLATNDTIEGRAKNRRVEIKVLLDTTEITTKELTVEEFEADTNPDDNIQEDTTGEDTEDSTLP